MNDLRSQMHRVGDAVDPLPVDDDLWQRGVAARRRGQVLVVAAVLAIVVSVAGTATLVGGDDREARTASGEVVEGGAIPRSIVDPGDLDPEGDLAVGRASAAFISQSSEPVVITAVDGVPHELDLAGWVTNSQDPDEVRVNQSLALSPDGARLAWQGADDEDGRATVGVLDLVTGDTSTYRPLPPIAGLRLREMSWSSDSSWLAWICDDSPEVWVGRLRPGPEPDSQAQQLFGNIQDVAVDANGTLVFSRASGGFERIYGTGDVVPLASKRELGGVGFGIGRFSPDGRQIALRSSLSPASYTYDIDAEELLEHPFPAGTFEDGFVVPQGWLDDRLQLLLVQESSNPDVAELVVTTPAVDATSTWRRSVGVVEVGPAATLSLAVDLVPDLDGTSSQELTYDFPPPPERDISWIIGLGVAAAIAVLLALRWLWRRLTGM
ncbi:hypothetical protein [Nocardioides baculatus]|uniref:WD40 repeat domain-containing protein n=1 Tax=Nocardioides baculatus TaxID=2801337 RepID=A0ABS1L458_9ACTN|nr:hypothetical protein [Nocardioides baculatus]MBL0746312.1 hypothetical protein [Nocardioides baculatus]